MGKSINHILLSSPKVTLLVIGDMIFDRYLEGVATRISPEAPVPVVLGLERKECLGGAGNVVANLCGLGANVIPIGVIGEDESGKRIIDLLQKKGCYTDNVLIDRSLNTTVKTRISAGGQQIVRFDWDADIPNDDIINSILLSLPSIISKCDGVVISDYGKGICSRKVVKCVIENARSSGKMVLVDPKHEDFNIYSRASCITPNLIEIEKATKMDLSSESNIKSAAETLRNEFDFEAVVITRGGDGISVLWDGKFKTVPTEAKEVYDVSGAGDTVIATIAMCILAWGLDFHVSAKIANIAAGIVVSKRGTSPIDIKELSQQIVMKMETDQYLLT